MTNKMKSIITKYKKGCSAANDLFLRADRLEWPQGEVPPSHKIYTDAWITQISKEEFMGAFVNVYKSALPPNIKWTSLQVLLRTLWTQLKESSARDGDDRCLNCLQDPEHIAHVMFHCVVAHGTLQVIKDIINSGRTDKIDITLDTVLFLKLPNDIRNEERNYIADLLMLYKHVLYRLRFRERNDRQITSKHNK